MVAYSSEHDHGGQHKNEKKDCILPVTALSVILQKKKIKNTSHKIMAKRKARKYNHNKQATFAY